MHRTAADSCFSSLLNCGCDLLHYLYGGRLVLVDGSLWRTSEWQSSIFVAFQLWVPQEVWLLKKFRFYNNAVLWCSKFLGDGKIDQYTHSIPDSSFMLNNSATICTLTVPVSSLHKGGNPNSLRYNTVLLLKCNWCYFNPEWINNHCVKLLFHRKDEKIFNTNCTPLLREVVDLYVSTDCIARRIGYWLRDVLWEKHENGLCNLC